MKRITWSNLNKLLLAALFFTVLSTCNERPIPQRDSWKHALSEKSITQEAFTYCYIRAIMVLHSSAKVQKTGPLTLKVDIDGHELTCYLDNVWRQTAEDPESRVSVCETYWRGILAMEQEDSEKKIDKNDVVPIIKDTLYLEEVAALGKFSDPLYSEPLTADIVVVYAEDSEFQLRFLTESDIRKLSLPDGLLRITAVQNLSQKLQNIERHGNGPTFMITAGGTFESSLLLFDDIWKEQLESVEGDLIATAPSRDMLLFTGSRSRSGIEDLKNYAEKIESQGGYFISKTLLIRKGGKWEQFDENSEN